MDKADKGLLSETDIRNDIEHMHSNVGPALIGEAIADAMPIIRDVIIQELKSEPSALLGQKSWDVMLDQAKMFKAEQAACRASMAAVVWGSDTLKAALDDLKCPGCASTLIRNANAAAQKPIDLKFVCSKCGSAVDHEDALEAALDESLAGETFIAVKDGGEASSGRCPECTRETYVFAEDKCVSPGCGFSLDEAECAVCTELLTLDDFAAGNDSLCGYCTYKLGKDD